jgi:ribosomal protein L44E
MTNEMTGTQRRERQQDNTMSFPRFSVLYMYNNDKNTKKHSTIIKCIKGKKINVFNTCVIYED